MTIRIAASCAEGKAIVVASDQMLSAPFLTVEWTIRTRRSTRSDLAASPFRRATLCVYRTSSLVESALLISSRTRRCINSPSTSSTNSAKSENGG